MEKVNKVSSGAKWENIVGYSRAIRVGNLIEISGTASVGENGELFGDNDPESQTRQIIGIAEKALKSLGSGLGDVIRTRIYVTDIGQWEVIGKVHGEYFRETKPVTTMVEVSRLITPGMLVEIEFTAWSGSD